MAVSPGVIHVRFGCGVSLFRRSSRHHRFRPIACELRVMNGFDLRSIGFRGFRRTIGGDIAGLRRVGSRYQ